MSTGHLVEVPFGRVRAQGVVLGEVGEPAVPETRPVIALIDRQAVLTAAQISLAYFLSGKLSRPAGSLHRLDAAAGLGATGGYAVHHPAQPDSLPSQRDPAALARPVGKTWGKPDGAADRPRPAAPGLAPGSAQPGAARAAHRSSDPARSLGASQAGAHRQAGVFSGRSPPRLPKACQGRNRSVAAAAGVAQLPAARTGTRRCRLAVCRERGEPGGPAAPDRDGFGGPGRKPGVARSIAGRHTGVQRTAPPDTGPAGLLAGDSKERGSRQNRSAS